MVSLLEPDRDASRQRRRAEPRGGVHKAACYFLTLPLTLTMQVGAALGLGQGALAGDRQNLHALIKVMGPTLTPPHRCTASLPRRKDLRAALWSLQCRRALPGGRDHRMRGRGRGKRGYVRMPVGWRKVEKRSKSKA